MLRNFISDPDWLERYRDTISDERTWVKEINEQLRPHAVQKPDVSIIIPVYNEEASILKCLLSIAKQKTAYTFEVLCVDNNSKDRTAEILKKITVGYLYQPIQGCGPSRQMGLENAKGQFVLLADADCLYPNTWIDTMINNLKVPGVSCVISQFSFISDQNYKRWNLYVHELFRRVIAEVRNMKRPYYNAYGMSMAFYAKDGREIGFIMNNKRGEDGRMCFDLMSRGKVTLIRSQKAKVWTPARALEREGKSLSKILLSKLQQEVVKLKSYTRPHPPHDTKSS
jgi:glycosyltransferase involved in cell wall biosynthesis